MSTHLHESLDKIDIQFGIVHDTAEMGQPTSGNYGHAGRPGHRGGSLPRNLPGILPEFELDLYRELKTFEEYVSPTDWEKANIKDEHIDTIFAQSELLEDSDDELWEGENYKKMDQLMKTSWFKDMVHRQALCNYLVDKTDIERRNLKKMNPDDFWSY